MHRPISAARMQPLNKCSLYKKLKFKYFYKASVVIALKLWMILVLIKSKSEWEISVLHSFDSRYVCVDSMKLGKTTKFSCSKEFLK